MVDLIKAVNSAGETVFMWLRKGVSLSGAREFSSVHSAAQWYSQNQVFAYSGSDRRRGLDRRSGDERRMRVSSFERRQRPQGRRWVDEVERFL